MLRHLSRASLMILAEIHILFLHPTGKQMPGGGFSTEMCYTNFSARFVEFIQAKPIPKIDS